MDNEELIKKITWYEKKYGPYIEKRGEHNWKNLFRKPNFYEYTIFFMMMMSFFLVWAYYHDINSCQETLREWKPIVEFYASPSTNQFDLSIDIQGEENMNFIDDSLE